MRAADAAAEYERLVRQRLGPLARGAAGAEGSTRDSERDAAPAPTAAPDPWNAWALRARVPGAEDGPLGGLRLAVKDNTAVAGLPLRAGTRLLDAPFVPRAHAPVVARLLAAGATVIGKSACDDLCYSGGGHTPSTGAVRNPHDPRHLAGGSSGGSAALVAAGEVDAATGTDQGGSVAIPAAWCGVVGLKPTFGLVPYAGALPVEPSLDHLGFLARTVDDIARLLDAAAGRRHAFSCSDLAPREPPRVAFLEEAFGWPESEPEVDALVREEVARRFDAPIGRASVPQHRASSRILSPISQRGLCDLLVRGAPDDDPVLEGLGARLRAAFARDPGAVAPTVRLAVMLERRAPAHAARAYVESQRARPALMAAVDAALRDADVLAFPTVPFRAHRVPPPDAGPEEVVRLAWETHNTATFNLTGHPTLTLPAGRLGRLPVGVTLVARRGDEAALLGAGAAFEAAA